MSKRSKIAAGPGFSVTVLCNPSVLTERLGIAREEWPSTLRACQHDADAAWFAEAGRLTPEMLVSVRSLQTMAFQGLTRRTYVEARAIELVCDLWEQVAKQAPAPLGALDARTLTKVEKTRLHIDANFAEPLFMQGLARNVGTNETKLSQAFRTAFGMTVFEYVRNRRMEEARRLLRRFDMSVTEIAFEVGYEHSCNFSVAYKRHFGITPKSERAAASH
ncbi:AraC family transcriptional regulator [Novosphingobium sp. P6W]|uniref:helix-turn-helix transcriptional regulator n=1 Tax=Novosphingobium sp. P6W TaxID=1609758 RepID=UPI0013B472F6|nr:AraC family transcriptional regulator [Novosphingobium sp. P6W]